MSEIRKTLIWPLIEEVFFKNKKCTISTIIDIVFVKNLIRTLGLSISSYHPTSCTLNFNVKYQQVLHKLVTIIEDDTKLIQFTEILNKQPREFWLFLFTIPTDYAQIDFIEYFSGNNKILTLHMVVFFRTSFREIFVENNTSRGGLYQEISEDAKLILADLSHTIELDEFCDKLISRILQHPDTLQYFWTTIFMVEYGRYI